jgi:Domain of unknown function (DUF5666)
MMKRVYAVLAAAAAIAVAGCGGGSSSNNGTNTTTARVSQGALTAVSAAGAAKTVTVNGATIDDSAATIKVDDNPTGHEALQPGMVVTVKVDDKGKATEIQHHAQVRGRIDDATKTASTVTIGGQVVRVDDSTHFEDNSVRPANLTATTAVRVSGFPDDRGGLRATRIEKDKSTQFEFEVHGIVSNLDATAKTFTLTASKAAGAPSWTVNASGVTLPAGLANGSVVEVKSTAQAAAGGTITASAVKLDDDLSGEAEAELEGIVTSGTSSSFVVNGRTVTTTSATKWVGGAPADLVVGVKVEAEGALDAATGNIAATKVSFRDSLRFQSAVTALVTPGEAASFTMLAGTLTVHVSDVTRFDDGLSAASLATQNVEVRGYPTIAGGNDIVATRIRLGSGGGNPSTRLVIQGPVSNVDATAKTFKILGYTINASSASSLTRDDNPLSNDATPVLSQLTDGTVVKARADTAAALVGTTLTAKEVELEDDK